MTLADWLELARYVVGAVVMLGGPPFLVIAVVAELVEGKGRR